MCRNVTFERENSNFGVCGCAGRGVLVITCRPTHSIKKKVNDTPVCTGNYIPEITSNLKYFFFFQMDNLCKGINSQQSNGKCVCEWSQVHSQRCDFSGNFLISGNFAKYSSFSGNCALYKRIGKYTYSGNFSSILGNFDHNDISAQYDN